MKQKTTRRTPVRQRMSATDLKTIRARIERGPARGDVSQVLAAYAQCRRDALALLDQLEQHQQETML